MKNLDLNNFSKVSKEDWIQLAEKQLQGEDPFATLSWESDGHFNINPYYEQSDLEKLNYLKDFFSDLIPVNCKLYETVEVSDEKTGNADALLALEGGCDGIIFGLDHEVNYEILLNNILVDICDISMRADTPAETIPDNLKGFVITKSFSNAVESSGESEVDKIVSVLQNLEGNQHVLRIASSDFFLEIASIRALRFLIHDHSQLDPWGIQIHTSTPHHSDPDQQWFLNSTAGLASILGGTNSINFYTAKGSARTSRNVGNLIREESGIRQYTDQCGGSFYIESLTDMIIQECKKHLSK